MKITIPVIAAGAVAGAALITGGVLLATTLTAPGPADPFVASTIGDLRIVQQGANGYDVSFEVPADLASALDGADAPAADAPAVGAGDGALALGPAAADTAVAVQITDTPDYLAGEATDIPYAVDGDRVELATTTLEPGDHFVWITTGDERVSATVTIPDLAPRVWVAEGIPTIEFGESGDSSWSSYVDPEGKAVYHGADPAFGDDDEPLAEGLPIGETSFRVDEPDAEHPYYFLVFTGRDGDSTFVSSPIFADATQGPLTVDLTRVGGAPTYVITGFLGSRQADVERELRLRVGTFDAGNPGSTFFVENSVEASDPGRFRFEVPAPELDEGYTDLAAFLTEDGSTLEWSLDATGVDLNRRLADESSIFGMRRVEALQLTRVELVYDRLDVTLERSGTTAWLRVAGTFLDDAQSVGYQLVLKDATGERHVVADQTSNPARFSYLADLGDLDQSSVWYDVEFLDPATGETSPISTLSVRDMRQWMATESRTYAFADYEGLLKVFFDDAPFADARVQLGTVDGVPSLVATGRLVGTARADATLRIRTGDDVVSDVANSSAVNGAFRFVVDLRTLPEDAVWYDIVFRKISTAATWDFRSASADLAQTVEHGDHRFGFREFDGQLKVSYDLIPGTVDIATVELVDVAGTPTLRIEGELEGIAAGDAILRVRSGGQQLDVPNVASAPGRALFEFDLRALTQDGSWYDLLIGSSTTDAFADVATLGVDLSQTLVLGGRAYGLHDFNAQLKASFDDVSAGVDVTTAEIVDVAGIPTLRVTGTVAGTTDGDVFLRIRSGVQTLDIADSDPDAGEALFAFDLSGLTEEGTWYDLVVGVTSTGSLADLRESAADLAQTLLLDERTYGFHEYTGDLKVAYDDTPVVVTTSSATLSVDAGAPTLRVTGTYAGTTAADVFLRIRAGAQTIDVPNSATTAGETLFVSDLAALTQSGTWYDLLVGVTSTGQLVDLADDVADLSQTVTRAGRAYAFHEYNGDLKVAFDPVTVAFTITAAELRDVSGVATLQVTGTLTNLDADDVFLRIRSGSGHVDVPNSSTTAGEAFFDYDLSDLDQAGTWYDLLAGVTSTGDLVDLDAAVADLSADLQLAGRASAFHEWSGALKVAYDDVAIGVTVTSAELDVVAGAPVLRVEGTVSGTPSADASLRIATAGQSVTVANSATTAGRALFEYDLSALTELGSVYGLTTRITSTGASTAVPSSAADLAADLSIIGREHSFDDDSGELGLLVVDAPTAVQVSSVDVVDASGVPTLRVSGVATGAGGTDVFLRLRDGASSIDVANSAASAGQALFEYALDGLDSADYELLVGALSTGSLTSLDAALADPDQVVGDAGRSYGFADDGGDLLLAVTDTPISATGTHAELVLSSGVPLIRVTGTLVGTGNSDAFLRIRTGAQTVDVPNTATIGGRLLFEYAAAGLTQPGAWYDLVVGVTSTGTFSEIAPSAATMSQTVVAASRSYGFRDWAGALKVTYSAVTAVIAATGAQIVDVAGVPTLRVAGTFTNTDPADVFLRIRTGAQTVDVPNSATTAGQFSFAYDLAGLTRSGTWYDLVVGVTSSGAFTNLTPAVANMAETLTISDRAYSFKQYSGQLKVNWDDLSVSVSISGAELVDVSGTPTLRVTGTISNTTNADVFLRIRAGSEVINVANAASTAGQFSASYSLVGLNRPGVWYDLLVGVTSRSTIADLTPAIANMSQTLANSGRTYSFQQYSGYLKVTYSEVMLAAGQSILVDFGRNDSFGGGTTASPAVNGRTWNNIALAGPQNNSATVTPGTAASALRTTAGTSTTAKITMNGNGTGSNWVANGGTNTGGFSSPSTALLGDLAVGSATQDFFATNPNTAGTFTISGLDPTLTYTLEFYGSRSATDARSTQYQVTGSTGSQSATLATSGTNIGGAGVNYNNNSVATVTGVQPGIVNGGVPTATTAMVGPPAGTGNVAALTFDDGPNGATTIELLDYLKSRNIKAVFCVIGQNILAPGGADVLRRIVTDGHTLCNHTTSFDDMGAMTAAQTRLDLVENLRIIRSTLGDPNYPVPFFRAPNGSYGVSPGVAASLGELTFARANTINDWWDTDQTVLENNLRAAIQPGVMVAIHDGGGDRQPGIRALKVVVDEYLANGWTFALPAGAPAVGAPNGAAVPGTLVSSVQPRADGVLQVRVANVVPGSGSTSFGYLGIMRITAGSAVAQPAQTPVEVARWVEQDGLDPVAQNSVLFVGSSSIRRWESLTEDFADYNVLQRAWGGAHLSGVNDYAPWIVQPYHPSAVVLWAGTNDIRAGKSAQTVLADFRAFVATVKESNAAAEIFYISVTPTPLTTGNTQLNAVRAELNSLIAQEATIDPQIHYIDVATSFEALEANDPTQFTSLYVDNLHLSPEGYDRWLSIVRPAIAAVLPPNKTATANASTLQPGEALLFDFGPSVRADGDPTESDSVGNRWNNWRPTAGTGLVNVGEHVGDLVDTTGRDTGIGMTITAGFQANGKQHGGLQAPNGPDRALLGDLGELTATQDYFYSTADGRSGGGDDDLPGGFMMTGLDPNQYYEFRFFGSRASDEVRVTEYAVTGAHGRAAASLQTSGPGIGSNGSFNGNDDELAIVTGVVPDRFGQVWIDVTLVQGSFTHLNAMEILASPPSPAMAMAGSAMCLPHGETGEEPDVDSTEMPEHGSVDIPADGIEITGAGCLPADESGRDGSVDASEPTPSPSPSTPDPTPEPTPTPEPAPEPTPTPGSTPPGDIEPTPGPAPEPSPTPTPPIESAVVPGGSEPTQSGRRRRPA